MHKLERAEMSAIVGGEADTCMELDAILWVSIAFGQPEIALVVWGIMVGKGCFAK